MPENSFKTLVEANNFCEKYDPKRLIAKTTPFAFAETLLRAYNDGYQEALKTISTRITKLENIDE